jgi:hypothetical protein
VCFRSSNSHQWSCKGKGRRWAQNVRRHEARGPREPFLPCTVEEANSRHLGERGLCQPIPSVGVSYAHSSTSHCKKRSHTASSSPGVGNPNARNPSPPCLRLGVVGRYPNSPYKPSICPGTKTTNKPTTDRLCLPMRIIPSISSLARCDRPAYTHFNAHAGFGRG